MCQRPRTSAHSPLLLLNLSQPDRLAVPLAHMHQISMSQISSVITKETTMWRCWVGFNASHIGGAVQSLGWVFLPLRSSALHGTLKPSGYATINFLLLLSEILAARTSESSYR